MESVLIAKRPFSETENVTHMIPVYHTGEYRIMVPRRTRTKYCGWCLLECHLRQLSLKRRHEISVTADISTPVILDFRTRAQDM